MRRRIIAVLLSLSVGVAAMPMPVMAEGGSEVVLEAVEEAAPAEAAPEAEASVEEAAPVEEAEATDELLIVDEEAPAEVEAPAVEAEAPAEEESGLIEETVEADEADTALATDVADAVLGNLRIDLKYGNVTKNDVQVDGDTLVADATDFKVDYDPFVNNPYVPTVTLRDISKADKAEWPKEGTDYSIEYKGCDHASQLPGVYAKIEISFNSESASYGNLGNMEVRYIIMPYSLKSEDLSARGVVATVEYDQPDFTYNGEEQVPDLTVKLIKGKEVRELKPDVDYDVQAANGVAPNDLTSEGDKQIVIRGTGDYKNTIGTDVTNVRYKIKKANVNRNITLLRGKHYVRDAYGSTGVTTYMKAAIYNDIRDNIYDTLGMRALKDAVPQPGISIQIETTSGNFVEVTNNITDAAGSGYYVNITDAMLAPGTHRYRVAISNYPNYEDGTLEADYVVDERSSLETIYDSFKAELDDLTYNGKDQSGDVWNIIKDGFERYFIESKYDRTIDVITPDTGMVDAGPYPVIIKGTVGGGWQEDVELDVTVTINPKQMADGSIPAQANGANGIVITTKRQLHSDGTVAYPSVVVKDNQIMVNGAAKELKEGVDYECTIMPENGILYAHISGKGNYKTTQTVAGKESPVEIIVRIAVKEKVPFNDNRVIRARINPDKIKDLVYHKGQKITFEPKDIIVEEISEDSILRTLDPSEYYISGYDYGTDAPIKAGDHFVGVTALTGPESKYEGTTWVPFTVRGQDIKNVFEAGSLESKEVLVQLDVPVPSLAFKDSGIEISENWYNCVIYDQEAYNANPATAPVLGRKGEKITFNKTGSYVAVITPDNGAELMEGITGSIPVPFKVVPRTLDNKYIKFTSDPATIVWPGRPVTLEDLEIEVKDTGLVTTNVLKPGVDYDLVSLNDGNKIGPATVTIKGRGNYDGQLISGNVVITRVLQFRP